MNSNDIVNAINLNIIHLNKIRIGLRSEYEKTKNKDFLEPIRDIEQSIKKLKNSAYLLKKI